MRARQKIDSRSEDTNVDKKELAETVQRIQEEASKGEEANPKKVERWLDTLANTAPDILELTVTCLTNPVAGVASIIRKIAEKVKKK